MTDNVYDDGSEIEIETDPDDLPSSGVWVDPEEALHNPTPDELTKGFDLGRSIDIDDDEDNGMPGGPGEVA